jgi:hypothetical protein
MTTEVNHTAGRDLHRIDPALRAAAAGLDVLEFDAATLPLERERLNHANARRAAAVNVAGVESAAEAIVGPTGGPLGRRTGDGFDCAAPAWEVSRDVQTLHARSLHRAVSN